MPPKSTVEGGSQLSTRLLFQTRVTPLVKDQAYVAVMPFRLWSSLIATLLTYLRKSSLSRQIKRRSRTLN